MTAGASPRLAEARVSSSRADRGHLGLGGGVLRDLGREGSGGPKRELLGCLGRLSHGGQAAPQPYAAARVRWPCAWATSPLDCHPSRHRQEGLLSSRSETIQGRGQQEPQ